MDDLISRAAILEALGHFNDYVNGDEHFLNGIETAKEIAENLPAVDAAPVKCGQWTERHVDYALDCAIDEVQTAKCSVCGLYHTTPYLYSFMDFKFCPNCGAKMMEVEHGNRNHP